jgi:putative ABC transport system substrate-binding protein
MLPPLRRSPSFSALTIVRSTVHILVALALFFVLVPSARADKVFHVAALVAEDQFVPAYKGFRSKMSELGYSDKTVRYEFYNAKGDMNELKVMVQKIVQQKPDIIVTSSTTATVPIAKATEGTNIPVVFLSAGNPLKLVKSYSGSGNNLTGISTSVMELTEKRLILFRDIVPAIKRLIFITNARSPNYEEYLVATREAAKRLAFILNEIEIPAANADEVKNQIGRLTRKAGEGLFIPPDVVFVAASEFIIRQAIDEKLPTVGPNVMTVRRGALAAYSADYYSLGQQGAKLVDKIVRGARPSDLPIELPYKLALAINLKVAGAIGVKVPKGLLLRADELIE